MKIIFEKNIEPMIAKSGRRALEVGKNMNYTISNARIGEKVYTRSCNSCSSLLLNAGNHNFLTHIDPKTFNMRIFTEMLKAKICNFQDLYGAAKAVIIGGWATDRKDPFVNIASDLVYSTMAIVADNIPLTMICGKKNGVKSLDNVFANKDKVYLASQTFHKLGITSEKTSAAEIEKRLSSCYEWVEIDKSMID